MATIIHSKQALGITAVPRPQTAGAVHAAKFRWTFTTALAAGAILELGVLPEFANIVGYKLIPEGDFAGVTCSAGMMNGDLGADSDARDAGVELFSVATALTQTLEGTKAAAFNVTEAAVPRGIGLKFSAAVAADAAKKLCLLLLYRQ